MKILVAGFLHETNTFAPSKARMENFENGEGFPALRREAGLFELKGVNIPVGGFLKRMEETGHELVPVIWAAASPSGPVAHDAFEQIVGAITEACLTTRPDAVYLDLHGAMVVESYDDGEGEILSRVRREVGRQVPIVVSLDLHANMSSKMFDEADAMVAYRTYPHVDMAETGRRAAEQLLELLNGRELACSWRRLPFLIPINSGTTFLEPARSLYAGLQEADPEGVVLSFAAGFPASDTRDCGPVVFGYGSDADRVLQAVLELEEKVIAAEGHFKTVLLPPEHALEQAEEISKTAQLPVVIADTQDNPGAGGDATTTGLLRAALDKNIEKTVIASLWNADIAAQAHRAGIGNHIKVTFPGSAIRGDQPLTGNFEVEVLTDGHIVFDGPMMHGNQLNLGPTAVLKGGNVQVIVTSRKAQLMDRNQLRMAGVEPETQRILILKSSVHFRADFEPIAAAVLVAQAPGPMAAVPADLPWTNLIPGTRLGPLGPAFHPGLTPVEG